MPIIVGIVILLSILWKCSGNEPAKDESYTRTDLDQMMAGVLARQNNCNLWYIERASPKSIVIKCTDTGQIHYRFK